MDITLLYFARLRERLGCARESLALPAGVQTVAQLRAWLAVRGEPWTAAFTEIEPIRAALNQTVVEDENTPIPPGAEIAFFPPVTGG